MPDEKSRLHRQFDAIGRMAPASRRIIDPLLHGSLRRFRLPIAGLLIIGSFLSILPVFGLWMLPLGLMLLALDVPLLRPWVSSLLIRARRRVGIWRHSADDRLAGLRALLRSRPAARYLPVYRSFAAIASATAMAGARAASAGSPSSA